MFKITRLQIEKFRNVDATELEFADDFVLLLGKNGTGKTTLLNLIAAMNRMNFDQIQGTTHIEWTEGGRTFELRRTEAGDRELSEVALHGGIRTVARFTLASDLLRLGRWSPGARFDEALEFFEHLTRSGIGDIGLRVPPVTSHWPLSALARFKSFGDEALRWDDTNDPVLHELVELLGVKAIHASMDEIGSESEWEDTRTRTYAKPTFKFVLRDGSTFLHDRLSFGQKRLLAFWYYQDGCRGRPVVADELVNGFHYDWIDRAVEKLRPQQSFLSSQNPLLIDRIGNFDSVEKVQRSFITCRTRETENGERRLVWKNATKEQAESFLRGYQTGLAHVSEVLRDEDLW